VCAETIKPTPKAHKPADSGAVVGNDARMCSLREYLEMSIKHCCLIRPDCTITAQDLKRALADMGAFFDVTPEDLEQLIHASELHAKRRSISEVLSHRV